MPSSTKILPLSEKLSTLIQKVEEVEENGSDKKALLAKTQKLLSQAEQQSCMSVVEHEVEGLENFITTNLEGFSDRYKQALENESNHTVGLSELKNKETPDKPHWVPEPIQFEGENLQVNKAEVIKALNTLVNDKKLGVIGAGNLEGKRNFLDNFVKNVNAKVKDPFSKSSKNIIIRPNPQGGFKITFPTMADKKAFLNTLKENQKTKAKHADKESGPASKNDASKKQGGAKKSGPGSASSESEKKDSVPAPNPNPNPLSPN